MHVTSSVRAQVSARMGYNGQLHEPFGAWQALGNGHRIYNPVLMRFHSADGESPFARGGINAYAYCGTDPINHADQDGRGRFKIMALGLVFTGLTGALGAASRLPEDKTAQTILTIATMATGLIASSIGGYYFTSKYRKSRAIPASRQSTPDTPPPPIDATAPPLTPVGAPPSPNLTRHSTVSDASLSATPPTGSIAAPRRMSAPAAGQGGGRQSAPVPGERQRRVGFNLAASPATSALGPRSRSIRRASIITSGPYRSVIGKSGRKVGKPALSRRKSESPYYGGAS